MVALNDRSQTIGFERVPLEIVPEPPFTTEADFDRWFPGFVQEKLTPEAEFDFRLGGGSVAARLSSFVVNTMARALTTASSSGSIPTTRPGATHPASPTVIEPSPQPTSRTDMPGRRWGRRKAAFASAVRSAYIW
jgi:hypothetical protein